MSSSVTQNTHGDSPRRQASSGSSKKGGTTGSSSTRQRRKYGMPVGHVDAEVLRSRLVSVAPAQCRGNPDALVFTHSTRAQERRRAGQKPMLLEILVCVCDVYVYM